MSKKILIVDDEDYIRLLMQQTLEELEEAGVSLLSASNGVEALEIIKLERPQLIFLDVMMPQMNGYEVCQRVKHELQLEDIHIVMLTARGQEFDKEKGLAVGADRYITKPFDPDEILAYSCKVLGLPDK